MNYLYVFITVIATVLGQIAFKIGSQKFSPPEINSLKNLIIFIWQMMTNLYLLSGLLLAFIGAASWTFALKKFELNHAYPFMSLTLVLVMIVSTIIFKESLNLFKILGSLLIVAGIIFIARS